MQKRLGLDARRHRVVGRVSLYLDAQAAGAPTVKGEDLDRLRTEIEQLQAEVDTASKLEALSAVQYRIGHIASDLMKRLPFAAPRMRAETFHGYDLFSWPRKLSWP